MKTTKNKSAPVITDGKKTAFDLAKLDYTHAVINGEDITEWGFSQARERNRDESRSFRDVLSRGRSAHRKVLRWRDDHREQGFQESEHPLGQRPYGQYRNLRGCIVKTRNQILRRKLIVQRLMGLALLLFSLVIVLIAVRGVSFEDCDATAAILLAPLGFWMFFTKNIVIY